MDIDLVPNLFNNSHPQFYQPETIMEDVVSFDEQLADVLLGDDFSYPLSVESNTFYPQWDIGSDLLDQIITPPSYASAISGSHTDDNNNNKNDNGSVETLVGSGVVEEPRRSKKRKDEIEKQAVSSGGRPRRKRQPTQVYDHILAERKRREVLSHMFISLSSMILGLKKDLFVAGTDTTSSTLEWAMTEILRNPKVHQKAQIEMEKVIGKDESIQESDISKLPYIQAIVKETLRLHPPAPFLIPHNAEKEIQLDNFIVPKNSTIWVNLWSIGHNSNVWPNPESFSPKRFLDREIDFKGRFFELIPFGTGRRICPGLPLAYRMTHLMLATLLHSFNWKYGHEASPQDIDMKEKFGLTLQKVEPLLTIPLSK